MSSIGKKERELLRHLVGLGNERFNVKAYSRLSGVARSTINDMRSRLDLLGLVERLEGDTRITLKGKALVEFTDGGVGRVSDGVAVRGSSLSVHRHRFVLPVGCLPDGFDGVCLRRMGALDVRVVRLRGWVQFVGFFDRFSVTVNTRNVVVQVDEFVGSDLVDADVSCLNLVLEVVVPKLRGVGVVCEGVFLERGHWARVGSVLADWLVKNVDGRYFLELEDGSRFWVDCSKGVGEDETDDRELRGRLDEVMGSLKRSRSDFVTVDKVLEGLRLVAEVELARLKLAQQQQVVPDKEQTGIPDYFG